MHIGERRVHVAFPASSVSALLAYLSITSSLKAQKAEKHCQTQEEKAPGFCDFTDRLSSWGNWDVVPALPGHTDAGALRGLTHRFHHTCPPVCAHSLPATHSAHLSQTSGAGTAFHLCS